MSLNNRSYKIPLLLLSLMLSSLFHSGIFASENEVELSQESVQLLDHIKKGVEDYNKNLKSGKVEFTVTQNRLLKNEKQKLTISKLFLKNQKVKKVEFENVGTWHIVCNFEGARSFYDVRIRKKMEFNGEPLPNWTEKRYQFEIDNEKMLIRELKDSKWVQHPQPMAKDFFRSEFNPRRWGWNPGVFSFAFLIKYAPPIRVEQVEVDGAPLYLLTLHRVRHEKSRMTKQLLWIDPQKGYRPIQFLSSLKGAVKPFLAGNPDGTLKSQQPNKYVYNTRSTFQIEQFNQDLWFPKTATYTLSYDPFTQQGFRNITMQVQKAIFNIPIDEKDLRFPD